MKRRMLVLFACMTLLLLLGWITRANLPNWRLDRIAVLSLSRPQEAIPPSDLPDKDWIYLDARSPIEYQTSHIPGAKYLGNGPLPDDIVQAIPFAQPLLVYCTIGKRSESMVDSLRKMGYTDVTNLFGGLFAWAEAGYPLVNHAEQPTDTLHGYSDFWALLSNSPHVVTTPR